MTHLLISSLIILQLQAVSVYEMAPEEVCFVYCEQVVYSRWLMTSKSDVKQPDPPPEVDVWLASEKMSWLQKIDLLDMKLKHVLATVVLVWLFALGVTRRAEQSNGSSSDVVSRFQNHRKPQKILFENAIKAKPKINVKKTPVKNKEQMKKRYTINEEVAEVVSLHKDSGNPHLLITFTNDAEAKSMKV